jgi:probable rRNA maturation factor
MSAYELGFHFIAGVEMARINEQFLQHEGSTDVLTFDHGSSATHLHGEIFISVPDALKQARQFKTTWQSEIVRYLIHGLLHLRGLDDLQPEKRREMKREENRLLRFVESRFAVGEIGRRRRLKAKTRKPS